MIKNIIIPTFLLSTILTIIMVSLLYVLTETNMGDWIANLVIHLKLV
jgi:hypothetical protein